MTTIKTLLRDAEGRLTGDESVAVHGDVVELEPDGAIVRCFLALSWDVDPGSLQGNEGQLATRPSTAANAPSRAASRARG